MSNPIFEVRLRKCDLSVPSDGKKRRRFHYQYEVVSHSWSWPDTVVILTDYCDTKKKAAQEAVAAAKKILALVEALDTGG